MIYIYITGSFKELVDLFQFSAVFILGEEDILNCLKQTFGAGSSILASFLNGDFLFMFLPQAPSLETGVPFSCLACAVKP